MKKWKRYLSAVGFVAVLLVAADSRALISTKFTPVQLVEASRDIVPGELAAPEKNSAALSVGAALKGTRLKGTAIASDGKPWADVTEKLQLASRSRVACWADFSGNGRTDLLSWDGKKLSLHRRGQSGTFTAESVDAPIADCVGLSALGVGAGKRAGALVATAARPVLLVPDDTGAMQTRPLANLRAYSAKDGSRLADTPLPAMAVHDGLAAAYDRLYIATRAGEVIALDESAASKESAKQTFPK